MRHDHTWLIAEINSLLIVVGVVFDHLPGIATLLAIAWYLANLSDWHRRRRRERNLPPDAGEEAFQDGPELGGEETHAHHSLEDWHL